jgi:hypothetical protein
MGEPGSFTSPCVAWSTDSSRPCESTWSQLYTSSIDRTLPDGTPASDSIDNQCSAGDDAKSVSIRDTSASRLATRRALVAKSTSVGSQPKAPHSARHSPSEPHAICTGADAVANMPYGAIDGWWSPASPGTSPATVQRVPWNACTPTMPASSEVRTTRPRPVRERSCRAATTPNAPFMPAIRSAIGTPTLVGSSVPVIDIRPPSPCAIWS